MSIRKKAATGVKWTATSTLASAVFQYLKVIVLAWVLTPDDFGLIAIATLVTGLGHAFSDMGISNAIIWRQDASKEELSSLYWLNYMLGFFVFLIACCSAPIVVELFSEPRLRKLIPVAAIAFLITPAGQQFQVMLKRELDFKRLAYIEITTSFFGAAVAIVTALLGTGAYSLVYGQIAQSALGAAMLSRIGWRRWRPMFHFRFSQTRRFLRFGVMQTGSNLLSYFSQNIDYMFVGYFMSTHSLGLYMMAYKIVVEPFGKINPVLIKVAFPVFAKRQDNDAVLRRGYCELSRIIAYLMVPIFAVLIATAPVLLPAVLGEKWIRVATIVQILSLMGILLGLNNVISALVPAKGRADLLLLYQIVKVLLFMACYWVAAQHGLIVMAWAEVATAIVVFGMGLGIVKRIIGLSIGDYLYSIVHPIIYSCAAGLSAFATIRLLGHHQFGEVLQIAVSLTAGFLVYIAFVLLRERKQLKEYYSLISTRSG